MGLGEKSICSTVGFDRVSVLYLPFHLSVSRLSVPLLPLPLIFHLFFHHQASSFIGIPTSHVYGWLGWATEPYLGHPVMKSRKLSVGGCMYVCTCRGICVGGIWFE